MATVERDSALGSSGAAPEALDLPPGSEDDKRLTLAFQQGDATAYQTIYKLYGPRVHSICVRMLGAADAEEAEQETFLRVFQALGRFNGRYQLGAWIGRIATNVCLDQIRARHRKPSEPVPTELLELQPGPTESEDPAQILVRKSESRRVLKLLSSLPPLHRAAIVLRDWEGFSYEDIARALDLSEFQVKALLHRARKRFRRSWVDGVAAILPMRLAQRFRGFESTAREQTSQAITSVVQTTAPTCASVFQQCGQYVTDHVAGAVAAAIVGTAAVSGAVVAANTHHVRPDGRPVAAADSRVDAQLASVEKDQKKDLSRKKHRKTGASAEVLPTLAPTGEEPQPSPSPTDESTPSPSPSSSEAPEGGPPGNPPQESVPVALGFDRGDSVSAAPSSDHRTKVDCDNDSLEQRIEAPFHDGDEVYGAALFLKADGTSAQLELTLIKDGQEYDYISGQSASATWSIDDESTILEISGTYVAAYNSRPEEAGLPSSGSFTATLDLDCDKSYIDEETVSLTRE